MATPMMARLLARVPLWSFNKHFRRTIAIAFTTLFFVAILQIQIYRYATTPPKRAPNEAYYVKTIEDHNEPYTMSTSSSFNPIAFPAGNNMTLKQLCASFPHHLLDKVQPVLKTGFTDAPGRMLSQMESCSACFEPGELLIFSDLDDTFQGHKVIDVLATLPQSYHTFRKFRSYLEQKRLRNSGASPAAFKKIDGWSLDKFKFIAQVEQAWKLKPDRDFYVFYETDTYVFWDPLLRFLNTLDPDTPLYMGSASPGRIDEFGRKTWFANGGPGYVLSRATIKQMLRRRVNSAGQYADPPLADRYRDLLNDDECCGDSALGYVIWESGVQMQSLYPMFSQHPFQYIPYDAMRWCSPLFSLHKASFDEMRALFRWEFTTRSNEHATRHSDVWEFYKPGSEPLRNNWRNDDRFSHKVDIEGGIATKDACEAHCKSLDECFMWMWNGDALKECFVSERVVIYGQEAEPERVHWKMANYTSGWIVDKVEKWRDEHKCSDTEWFAHSFSRIF
ncbi:hypothetical protein NLG97_g2981 [Lecanicillium saksenae]|uniref:Uncharacterized protein n=1 Tax=Lecanicillium saksenae TaxID=468837 RepID=A0ACC1R215_9HYPO|nr:hypothetical protein NLG97_g2981 [Lecanicillium saksenae]